MNERPKSIHYRITQYFLNNHRLTILSLIVLVGLGIASVMMLKTTGFPSAEVKYVLVQTIYPGASAETITTEVTQPLEGAIKGIDGIETYTSRSLDSFSSISVQVSQDATTDAVRSQIDSAVRSADLPESITPKVVTLDFSNADLVLSVSADSLEEMYALSQQLSTDIREIPETRSVETAVDIEHQLVVTIDTYGAAARGISINAVRTALSSLGELLPVASGLPIDDQEQSIVTTFPQVTQESIRSLHVTSFTGERILLSDIATLAEQYTFADGQDSVIGVRDAEGRTAVVPAVTLFIKTTKDIDQGAFVDSVHALVHSYADVKLILPGEETVDRSQSWVIQHYAANTFNQNQVDEVIGGLIGAPLKTDSMLKYAGWILGGIQLVFLVMLAFVSWRAAIVAALAIPLSLVFATIYIYLIGEQLNTLVLFSLVLVIGLVVDPALVILESIQRKIDLGLRGRAAALAAIEDVGRGLFMATLTNIIVFLPFGLISGFLGEFFIFIPRTIIPATIGSYIVPVIFLAWMGGMFLRPSKHTSESEEKNLWAVARWVIRTNERILRSRAWMRVVLLFVIFAIPLAVTGYLFGAGKMKIVQFASSTDPNYLNISGEYAPAATLAQRNTGLRAVIDEAVSHEGVQQVYPLAQGLYYFVNLEEAHDRTPVARDIASAIQEDIQGLPAFFDIKTRIDQVGPPVPDYEVALSVKVQNQEQAERIAKDVGERLHHVCYTADRKVRVQLFPCGEGAQEIVTKVDDGFTEKTKEVITAIINRDRLQELQLTVPGAPLSAVVNRVLRDTFLSVDDAQLQTLDVDGENMILTLAQTNAAPQSLDDIRNTVVYADPQRVVKLSDIADIQVVNSPSTILRVNGQTLALIQGRLKEGFNDQQVAAQVTQAVVDFYETGEGKQTIVDLGLKPTDISAYSEGSTAENNKSFQDLFLTLIVAIVLTYVVLAVFFESFTQPVVILFTIPLTFLGIFPGLAWFVDGQFGFLEIIGLIILVGIVENVAIFLIDAARQKIEVEGWDDVRAISYASGVRFRPILLTKFTAMASLMPLAIFSEIYRSIAILIMLGLLTSGFTSLFTTPILFIFFRWLSKRFWSAAWWAKVLIILGFPVAIIIMAVQDRSVKK